MNKKFNVIETPLINIDENPKESDWKNFKTKLKEVMDWNNK